MTMPETSPLGPHRALIHWSSRLRIPCTGDAVLVHYLPLHPPGPFRARGRTGPSFSRGWDKTQLGA